MICNYDGECKTRVIDLQCEVGFHRAPMPTQRGKIRWEHLAGYKHKMLYCPLLFTILLSPFCNLISSQPSVQNIIDQLYMGGELWSLQEVSSPADLTSNFYYFFVTFHTFLSSFTYSPPTKLLLLVHKLIRETFDIFQLCLHDIFTSTHLGHY